SNSLASSIGVRPGIIAALPRDAGIPKSRLVAAILAWVINGGGVGVAPVEDALKELISLGRAIPACCQSKLIIRIILIDFMIIVLHILI
ncbi:MAG: hypothetical protein HQ558_03310, partial [Candidatus Omnitrophica bacterium]|nr:hypothetical protein [Candidatus Omnitrophota bacterium]